MKAAKFTSAHPAALDKPFIPLNRIIYRHPYIIARALQKSDSIAPKRVTVVVDAPGSPRSPKVALAKWLVLGEGLQW